MYLFLGYTLHHYDICIHYYSQTPSIQKDMFDHILLPAILLHKHKSLPVHHMYHYLGNLKRTIINQNCHI